MLADVGIFGIRRFELGFYGGLSSASDAPKIRKRCGSIMLDGGGQALAGATVSWSVSLLDVER
jgi:hypothetical protein